MPLKSRNEFPPGGWPFYQAETGWTSPPHIGFSATVDAIISHRQSNPRFKLATDRGAVETELENYTIARLRSQYGDKANQWIVGDGPPASFTSAPLRRRAVGAVDAAKSVVHKTVAGIGLIMDFIGPTLKPVDRARAEKRAYDPEGGRFLVGAASDCSPAHGRALQLTASSAVTAATACFA